MARLAREEGRTHPFEGRAAVEVRGTAGAPRLRFSIEHQRRQDRRSGVGAGLQQAAANEVDVAGIDVGVGLAHSKILAEGRSRSQPRLWVGAVLVFGLLVGLPLRADAQQTASFQDGVTHGGTYDRTRDVIIKDGVGTTANFGNATFLRVTTQDIGLGLPTWSLLKWDIAGDVPPGCVVLSATITLEVDPSDPGATTQAYQLTRDWVEGDGNPASGATWTTFDGATAWGAPGANDTVPPNQDRIPTIVANIPGGAGTQVVALNAAGIAMVQAWVDDPTINFGINLRSGSTDGVNYASREDGTPGNRPRLDIVFDLPNLGGGGPGNVTFQQGVGGYTGAQDSYMRESAATTIYGNATFMWARGQLGQRRRPILRFTNLSPTIPPGSTITGASLSLYAYNAGNGSSEIYEVLRPWVETQLNWNQFSTGNNWGAGGANQIGTDRTNVTLGNMPGAPSGGFLTANFNATGITLVQRWLDTPATNEGVVLAGPTSYTNDTRFRTRNHGTVAQRPILTVSYVTVPTKTITVAPGPTVSWLAGPWVPPGPPAGGELVIVQGGGTLSFDDPANPALQRLVIQGGTTLQVPANTFSVTELLVVENGSLTIGGPAVVTNVGGVKVLPAGQLFFQGGGTLALNAASCWVGGELASVAGGTILGALPGTPIDVQVKGVLNLDGLTFQNGDVEGLHVFPQAAVTRLRNTSFGPLNPALGAGARHLTIEAPSLDVNAPGNVFGTVNAGQFNVRLVDSDTVTPNDVVLNIENRATSGVGAGPALENEVGGFVNWVHAAPDTTAGTNLGFPKVAYERATFSNPYAIYAAFADVTGPGTTDRIHVFDPSGTADGVDQGYFFDVPQANGDIVGLPWNDQVGAANVVWALTTTGNIIRWTDPGSGTGSITPDYVTPIAASFTTPPLTHEGSYVYGAGLNGASQPRFYMMNMDGSLFTALATADGLNEPISTELSSEIQAGTTMIFAGTGSSGFTSTVTLVNEDFESGVGAFVYTPNTFRSTTNPGGNVGVLTPDAGIPPDANPTGGNPGSGVKTILGSNTSDMSGGWAHTFNVTGAPVNVVITFDYRLWSSERFEPDEYCEALFSLDGTLYGTGTDDFLAKQTGDGNGLPNMDTGWLPYTVTLNLGDGPHTMIVGGFLKKSTETIEIAQAVYDNVSVIANYGDGRIYRINTSLPAVDADSPAPTAPVQAAPYPAFGGGLFVGDLSGTIHGIDQTTMLPLAGWPVQPNANPMRCNVWQDFFNGRLFWGNEVGELFGYDMAGSALPGYPSVPMGPTPIRGGGSVLLGVLYVTNSTGRLVAIDASSGLATPFPDNYRFGDTIGLSRMGFDWTVGRMMIATTGGKWVVVDRVADPTPGNP